MATTAHHSHRLSRKELRQPDDFVNFFEAAGDYVVEHLLQVVLAGIGALLLILLIVAVWFHLEGQKRAAADAFYQAINTLDKKNYQAASGQFAKLAVDHPHLTLGHLAIFYEANAELADNEPAKARVALQKYLAEATGPRFRELAMMQLGVADEDLGDYAAARQSYQQAASLRGSEEVRAEMNLARLQLRAGDKAAAVITYQRLLSAHPDSPQSGAATEALAQLGVATPPAGSAVISDK